MSSSEPTDSAIEGPAARRAPRANGPRPRRIGLCGGSFDPVHAGHLHAGRAARDRFQLDRVVFMPAYRSPFKPGRTPAPGTDRLRMVEIAIAGERAFEASDIELARGGPSYTIDTVRSLRNDLGEPADAEIFLVIGSDNLTGLPGWRAARELVELAQPVVVHREGDPDVLLAELESAFGPELAAKFECGYLRLPPVAASSTDARAVLGIGTHEPTILPTAVLDYIRAHGLYGAGA